jgi:hypothetical protein
MGNQSCCPIQYTEGDYRYRITYSFLAGDMLTIVLDNDGDIMHYWGSARRGVAKPDQDSAFRMLAECNAWRRAAKEYLSYGDMIKPKQYECDEFCAFTVVRRQSFTKKVPKVLSNAFVHQGKRADIFVNYEKEPVKVRVPISEKEKVFLSSEDFANGKWETREKDEITIAPLSVVLIEDVQ